MKSLSSKDVSGYSLRDPLSFCLAMVGDGVVAVRAREVVEAVGDLDAFAACGASYSAVGYAHYVTPFRFSRLVLVVWAVAWFEGWGEPSRRVLQL